MKENKNNVLLTIIGAATLLVAIVGASFAYFSATGGTATQDVKTGELKISAVAGAVNGANIKPVDADDITTVADKIANSEVVKLPITVTTTDTNISASYDIFLTTTGVALNSDDSLSGGNLSELKWELVKGAAGSETSVATGDFTAGNVTKLKLNSTAIDIPNGGSVDEYKLLVYILNDKDNAQDKLQGMTITAYTTVEAQQK